MYVGCKVKYPKDLVPLFDTFEILISYLLDEQRPNEQGIVLHIDEAL